RTATWRNVLTAVAVAAAFGASVILADISQHQSSPARQAGAHPASATAVSLTSFGFPVSFTVAVSPVTVLNPVTRAREISRVIDPAQAAVGAPPLARPESWAGAGIRFWIHF